MYKQEIPKTISTNTLFGWLTPPRSATKFRFSCRRFTSGDHVEWGRMHTASANICGSAERTSMPGLHSGFTQ